MDSAQAAPVHDFPYPDEALIDREGPVRRDDVDVVGLERLAIAGLLDREPGDVAEQLWHEALVRRVEMDDDHEGQARLGGMAPKNALSASRPPADAPMPTTRPLVLARRQMLSHVAVSASGRGRRDVTGVLRLCGVTCGHLSDGSRPSSSSTRRAVHATGSDRLWHSHRQRPGDAAGMSNLPDVERCLKPDRAHRAVNQRPFASGYAGTHRLKIASGK